MGSRAPWNVPSANSIPQKSQKSTSEAKKADKKSLADETEADGEVSKDAWASLSFMKHGAALDVAKNKANRVIVAQFASKKAIANTPHSPRLNTIISKNPKKSTPKAKKVSGKVSTKSTKATRRSLDEDFDYVADELFNNDNNIVLNIVRRQSTRSATGEKHPHTSSELPSNNSIPQNSEKSTSEAKKVVPQEWVGSGNRRGWQERINEAIKENRVIDYNMLLKAK